MTPANLHPKRQAMKMPFLMEYQLNRQLQLDRAKTPPALRCTDAHWTTLPGQPRIELDNGIQLNRFLQNDLCTPELDRLTPHLWLVCSRAVFDVVWKFHPLIRWELRFPHPEALTFSLCITKLFEDEKSSQPRPPNCISSGLSPDIHQTHSKVPTFTRVLGIPRPPARGLPQRRDRLHANVLVLGVFGVGLLLSTGKTPDSQKRSKCPRSAAHHLGIFLQIHLFL